MVQSPRLGAVAFAVAALLAAPLAAAEVVVFAAASLKNALDEIAASWSDATGHATTISYAGSSTLANQIAHGAPADIFISASTDWMDALEAGGHIREETRRDLLGNRLVLIAHDATDGAVDLGPDLDLAGLLGDRRLAMAMVDSVPAGIYGKAALVTLGVWESVAPRVAQTDNVRAALALVSLGEAPYGIVYATDAAAADGVAVVATFPPEAHPPIVYPAAVTSGSEAAAAVSFLDFLSSDAARAAFERQGFMAIGE
ncbi:molybdate ABC transporter substrate-binding protein [Roseitranquillus sediminis]|uniref:molybdate ABC transporter substrate-binding protein n=1 Tax=Roseitranquillus sediminis TaxID=2809051 RepID=UPI001D0C2752|nr:molybdate ABC transporter substrate-binding protein [Roseitranquillus sediminis]MBM9593787.1 molybdate ABC transporter substrate-binding protein [Roseitranquillus sediminis]